MELGSVACGFTGCANRELGNPTNKGSAIQPHNPTMRQSWRLIRQRRQRALRCAAPMSLRKLHNGVVRCDAPPIEAIEFSAVPRARPAQMRADPSPGTQVMI